LTFWSVRSKSILPEQSDRAERLVERMDPQRPFRTGVATDVAEVLCDDLGQYTATLVIDDAMVHVTPH